MKEELLKRKALIELEVNNSFANHNALLGRLAETTFLLDEILKKEKEHEEAKALCANDSSDGGQNAS